MYRRGLFLLLDNFSTTLFLLRIISHIYKAYFFNNHLNQLKNILFDGTSFKSLRLRKLLD